MKNPPDTSPTGREPANLLPVAAMAQGWLPRIMPFAFTASFAAVVLASGQPEMEEPWLQTALSSASTEVADGIRPSLVSQEGAWQLMARPEDITRKAGLHPAEPFHYRGKQVDRARARECLAAAAWYEAGDDPTGQRAVIQTVINRVNHPGFPASFCGVVFEGSDLPTGCQFTFTCDGSLTRRQPSAAARKRALALADAALDGSVDAAIGTATHYHASYVSPWWSGKLQRIATVGPHVFYRWFGARGSLGQRGHNGTEQAYNVLAAKAVDRFDRTDTVVPPPGSAPPAYALANLPAANADRSPGSVGSAIFLPVKPDDASGSWALAAMKACKGRADCQVLAYEGRDEIQRNQSRAARDRDRPVFLFVRDAASAMSIALWDCLRVERPRSSECLPVERPALAELMRERSRTAS